MSKKTTVAIAYDFDGTLSPGNMQEYNFIPELGIKNPNDFWQQAKQNAQEQHSDPILSYMYLMLKKAQSADISIRKENFINFGKGIKLFDGVDSWFERINQYAKQHKIELQHFIISSGLREMINGTPIAKHFKKIYASGFMYDINGVACWPALAINYTGKTQYLFRINKDSLDEFDDSKINKFIAQEQRPIPFSNMLFIGDGETDVPAMRTVKSQGGYAIAVYQGGKKNAKQKAQQLVTDDRATFATEANYSAGSKMEQAVQTILDKIAIEQKILTF